MKHLKFLLLLLPLISSVFGKGHTVDYKTVAIVLSQDESVVNVPSIELFRSVKEVVNNSDTWVMAPAWSVKINLKNQKSAEGLQDLGAIASFNRRFLTKGHPQSNMVLPKDKIHRSQNQIIKPIQIMLDTLALQGAIIVDCLPEGPKVVRSCGLYYYDRVKGKVVASSRKFFRAGVTDATNWSNHLVMSMDAGLKKVKETKSKMQITKVLSFHEEKEDKMNYSAEVEFWGLSPSESSLNTSVPGISLYINRENESFSYGLGFSYTDTEKDNVSYKQYDLGLRFTPRAFAAKSLIWELPIGFAASQRSMSKLAPTGRNSVEQLDAKFSIGPSLMWQMKRGTSFGVGASYESYHTLNQEVVDNSKLNLFSNTLRYSLRIKHNF